MIYHWSFWAHKDDNVFLLAVVFGGVVSQIDALSYYEYMRAVDELELRHEAGIE